MAQSTSTRDRVDPESESATESSLNPPAQRDPGKPPSPDWLSIDDHEEMVWEDSPSFKYVFSDFVLNGVFVGVGGILIAIGALQLFDIFPANAQLLIVALGVIMVGFGVGFSIINYRSYRRKHYVITTESIYRRWDGSTTKIEVEDINEILYDQSWLDHQFSCGSLKIGWWNDGKHENNYPAVPHPAQVKELLSTSDERDD
ncbi:PH domain-containing protein [Halococcus sp. PRR34]|uniref:PH domain-containing protein n=1 Tax=Halococcus sp. PRR34 TaxID=3020830 RepID=UPI002362065D|nr:PH domain-containing protein [Halococcus sp. PRR34]